MSVEDDFALMDLKLEVRGWNILTAYPVLGTGAQGEEIAILGLLGKMTGAAAVLGTPLLESEAGGGRVKVGVRLKALGVLGVYVSSLEEETWKERILVTIKDKVVPIGTVGVRGKVLEVDVEAAWEEMGLVAGWANEVKVSVVVVKKTGDKS